MLRIPIVEEIFFRGETVGLWDSVAHPGTDDPCGFVPTVLTVRCSAAISRVSEAFSHNVCDTALVLSRRDCIQIRRMGASVYPSHPNW